MTRHQTIARLRSYASPIALMSAGVALSVLPPTPTMAGPEDGVIRGGSGSISQVGKTTNIQQDTSKLIVDWRSFDVEVDETVNFAQPDTGSIALNRVTGSNAPSQISGALNANGNVWIVNENGVTFNRSAKIDVGGLLATTSDISDENFMAGDFKFEQPTNPDAKIINHGEITFGEAGLAALAAPGVENHGLIAGKLGTVVLEGAESFAVDLAGDGLIAFEVDDSVDAQVINTGIIHNDGGRVIISAEAATGLVDSTISLGGLVEAKSFEGQTGEIVVNGSGGLTEITGTLDTSSADAQGGQVTVLSDGIWLRDDATVDVSGNAGGGTALIGGTERGGGTGQTAKKLLVAETANVNASTTGLEGDGGTIIFWSEDVTAFSGSALAFAGENAGDGGFIEVSSAGALGISPTAYVDVTAAAGEDGLILLDPDDITIEAGGDLNDAGDVGLPVEFNEFGDGEGGFADISIDVAFLNTVAGNIELEAQDDIFINDSIVNSNADLQFTAQDDIIVNASVSLSGNVQNDPLPDLRFSAGDDVQINHSITVSGDVSIEAVGEIVLADGQSITVNPRGSIEGNLSLIADSSNSTPSGESRVLNLLGSISANDIFLQGGQTGGTPTGGNNDGVRFAGITATGDLTIRPNRGGIVQQTDAPIVVGGVATFDANNVSGVFDISLTNAGNDFGTFSVDADEVTLSDGVGGFSFGTVSATSLVATSTDGDILDTDGEAILVTGAGSLTADDGAGTLFDIQLDSVDDTDPANVVNLHDFDLAVDLTGDALVLLELDQINLGTISGGSLRVETPNNIRNLNSAGIIVSGATTLTAGVGESIVLDAVDPSDPALNLHDFAEVTVNGGILTLRELNDITLSSLDTDTSAFVNAGGAITLGTVNTPDFTLEAAGLITNSVGNTVTAANATFSTENEASNIVLNVGDNDFDTIDFSGADVLVTDLDDLTFAAIDADNLTVVADGAIVGAGAEISVSGTADLTADDAGTAQNISLTGTGIDLNEVIVNGAVVALEDQNSLTLAGGTATDLQIDAEGSISITGTLTSDSLLADAAVDVIVGGGAAVSVDGNTSVVAGQDINFDVDFQVDSLLADATRDITVGESVTGSVTGDATLDAGNDLSLGDASDLVIGGAASLVAGNALGVDDGLVLGSDADISVGGTLSVSASGNIQPGADTDIIVTDAASFEASGDIVFDSNATDGFGAQLDLQGQAIQLTTGPGDLQLGRVDADSLSVTAGGNISDSDNVAIEADGTTSITANAENISILLDNGEHDFDSVVVSGGPTTTITVTDTNSISITGNAGALNVGAGNDIDLGAITVGSLTANAGDDIGQSGQVVASTTASLTAGDTITVGQISADQLSAAAGAAIEEDTGGSTITVGTSTSLSGGTSVTLDSADTHEFGDLLSLDGGDVTLDESTGISLDTVNVNNLSLTANNVIDDDGPGGITVSGNATIDATNGTDEFDITLDDTNNDFNTLSFLGDNAVVTDLDDITISDSLARTSALIAAGGDITMDIVRVEAPGGFLVAASDGGSITATNVIVDDQPDTDQTSEIVLGGAGSAQGNATETTGDIFISLFSTDILRMNTAGTATVGDNTGLATLDRQSTGLGLIGTSFSGADFNETGLTELILDRVIFDGVNVTAEADSIQLGFVDINGGVNVNLTASDGGITKIPDSSASGLELNFEAAEGGDLPVIGARGTGNLIITTQAFDDLVNIDGVTTLSATEDIVLPRAINPDTAEEFGLDFGSGVLDQPLSLFAQNIALEDQNGLILGAVNASNNLAIRFNQAELGGDLTQTADGVTVGLNASFISGEGALSASLSDLVLDQAGTNSLGTVSLIVNDAVVRDANGISIDDGFVAGNLTIGADGDRQAGSIALNNLLVGTGNVQAFTDSSLQLTNVEVASGNLLGNASDAIQASSLVVPVGQTTLTSGGLLNLSGFVFSDFQLSAGTGFTLSNGTGGTFTQVGTPTSMSLSNLDLGDAAFISSNGISADLISADSLQLTATAGNIVLSQIRTEPDGDFTAVALSGLVDFADSGVATPGSVGVNGPTSALIGFPLNDPAEATRVRASTLAGAGGSAGANGVTEMLEVGGDATIIAASDIDLQQTDIDSDLNTVLNGTVTLRSTTGDVIVEADSALSIAAATVSAGDLTLRTNQRGAENGGPGANTQTITQTGAISVSGATTLITGRAEIGDAIDTPDEIADLADISLTGANNSLTGEVSVIGGDVEIANTQTTSLTASHAEGDLTLASDVDIDLNDVVVRGDTSLTSDGSIDLTDIDFVGDLAAASQAGITIDTSDPATETNTITGSSSLSVTGGDISADDIVIGALNASSDASIALSNGETGALALSGETGVSLSGIAAGNTTASAASGNISLSNTTVTGNSTLTADSGDVLLDTTSVTGTLNSDAGLLIDLQGVSVTGSSSLNAATSISGDGIELGGIDALAGLNVALSNGTLGDANLESTLGDVSLTGIGAGSVDVVAGNGISVSGLTAGATDLEAQIADIDVASTTISGDLNAEAQSDLQISDLTVTGDAGLQSNGSDISISGTSITGGLDGDAAGEVTLSDVDVGGATSLLAGTDITGDLLDLGGINADADGEVALSNAVLGAADLDGDLGVSLTGTSSDTLTATSTAGSVAISTVTVTGGSSLSAAQDIAGDQIALGELTAEATGLTSTITLSNSTTEDATLTSGGDVSLSALQSGDVLANAQGGDLAVDQLTAGTLTGTAGNNASVDGSALSALGLSAGGDLELTGSTVTGASDLTAGNSITGDDLILDDLGLNAGDNIALSNTTADDVAITDAADAELDTVTLSGDLSASISGSLDTTDVTVTGTSSVVAGGNLTAQDLTTDGLAANLGGAATVVDSTLGAVEVTAGTGAALRGTTSDETSLTTANGTAELSGATVTGDAAMTSTVGSVLVSATSVTGALESTAGDAIDLVGVEIGGATSLNADGAIQVDTLTGAANFDALSGAQTDLNGVTIAGATSLEAGGDLLVEELETAGIDATADGSIRLAQSMLGAASINAGTGATLTGIDAADLTVTSTTGTVDINTVTAAGNATLDALGGDLDLASATVTGDLDASADESLSALAVTVTGTSSLTATNADLTANDLTTSGLTASADNGVMSITASDLGAAGVLTGGSVLLDDVDVDQLVANALADDVTISGASSITGDVNATAVGDLALADTDIGGDALLYVSGGQSFDNVNVTGNAELLGTGSGLFQLQDLQIGGVLMLNAGAGSIEQTGGVLTVADRSIIYADGSVTLDGANNDFGTAMALFSGGNASITDLNDIQLGLAGTQDFIKADEADPSSLTPEGTNLAEFSQELLGAPQQSIFNLPLIAGVAQGNWDLKAAGSVNFDGALDGGGSVSARANNNGGAGGTVRFGDLVGRTAALGGVTIDNAEDPRIGLTSDGQFVIEADPENDIFHADSITVLNSTGTLELPRTEDTNLGFDLNITYFGVNLQDNLNYSGSPGLTAVNVTGAINGQRSQAAGLLPVGQRGATFQFNNCEIGSIASCSNDPPDLVLPQIDLSLPNIFSLDFESLGDVYVNFGNEELWTVPTLFRELDDEEGDE